MAAHPGETDTKACPYCAETIKAAAIVCRYCDRPLPGHEGLVPPAAGASDRVAGIPFPAGIDHVHFEAQGAVETRKKGLLRETYYGCGFRFSLAVADVSGALISTDGELSVALVPDRSGFTTAYTPRFGADEQGRQEARREAIFFKKLAIKASDFVRAPQTGGVSSGEEPGREGLIYTFVHQDPPIFSHHSYDVTLHLWLQSPAGQFFYANARTRWGP